ncbi:hypothetical protein HGB07_06415 [Candidatus Roizmanbacteria bacterium]|nr:hypothetical protein [Candidatus Roizmanbacteria bacterium]
MELSPPEQLIKQEKVEAVWNKDRQAFDTWLKSDKPHTTLELPPEALRHLAIPKRILELADDPEKVRLLPILQEPHKSGLFVVERKSKPVTDKDELDNYLHELVEAGGNDTEVELPPTIDQYHAEYPMLQDLTLYDQVLLDLLFTSWGPDNLHVVRFFDRPQFRGLGVGKSFYSQLRQATQEMGYRFLTGYNDKGNIGYFTQILGRHTLSEIRPELRSVLAGDEFDDGELKYFTIDFLLENDAEQFLLKPPQAKIT